MYCKLLGGRGVIRKNMSLNFPESNENYLPPELEGDNLSILGLDSNWNTKKSKK